MSFVAEHSYLQWPAWQFSPQAPTPVAKPSWLALNQPLAEFLNWPITSQQTDDGLVLFSGNQLPSWCQPVAQAYSGHQFGQLNPRLGDGRAILLSEVIAQDGRRFDIQLKGSGPTPYSRRGDGRAALGPVLREYMLSEWMHAVGVPTTRALAAVQTGEWVFRDSALPGAILTRVARSHLRVGSMQFASMACPAAELSSFVQQVCARLSIEIKDEPAKSLLREVIAAQARLVAQWMTLGFVHGVMNTDNMSLSGETIDYGPCAFLDGYDPAACFSSIDQQGRYAYRQQPAIAQWNLARLAEALLPLLADDEPAAIEYATEQLNQFPAQYYQALYQGYCKKLGFEASAWPEHREFIDQLLSAMASQKVDFTGFFRRLASNESELETLWCDARAWQELRPYWQQHSHGQSALLHAVNPAFIPRNQHIEAILAAAHNGDLSPFHQFVEASKTPFQDAPPWMDIPEAAPYCTFCGT